MKKTLKIIAISLLACFGVFVIVAFAIDKEATLFWFDKVIDWLNKPLPIVGVSLIAVLFFVWKVVVNIKYGKGAISKYQQQVKQLEDKFEEQKKIWVDNYNEISNYYVESLEVENKNKKYIVCMCNSLPNRKVKKLAKEIEEKDNGRKEEIISEAKAE